MNNFDIALISSQVDLLINGSTFEPSVRWTLLAGVKNAATKGPKHSGMLTR
jgi:hypothetical protein